MGCCQSSAHSSKGKTCENLIVHIVKAEMFKDFDDNGPMDLFVLAERVRKSDGARSRLARTSTAWDAGFTPIWNHTCLGFIPLAQKHSESICFRVYDDDEPPELTMQPSVERKPSYIHTYCGEAIQFVDDLMQKARTRTPIELPLLNGGDKVGVLNVSCELAETTHIAVDLTVIHSSMFRRPVSRVGVSGGTAPFFHLELDVDESRRWIGKDLSRAMDEVTFYEECKLLQREPANELGPLHNFMFEYMGVVKVPDQDAAKDAPFLDLLVIQNLMHDCKHLRMLDIKMGKVTAQAGWQGKSQLAAVKQSVVDTLTNSASQGFRLEGFDGEPPALESIDPLVDLEDFAFGKRITSSKKVKTKARRMMLQKMVAREMFAHLLDTHQRPADLGDSSLESTISPEELAEQVLASLCTKLVGLASACRAVAVPQKWIGSSVMLGFDDGELPSREVLGKVPDRGMAYIFDWGRSELNTIAKHKTLSEDEQTDRTYFWELYRSGIDVLSGELCLYYQCRFSHIGGWKHLYVAIYDIDSFKKPDFLGDFVVSLVEVEKAVVDLANVGASVQTACSSQGLRPCTFTYSVLPYRVYPENSRFQGAWRIHVHGCANLRAHPRNPDALVKVTAIPATGKEDEGFAQSSRCIPNCVDTEWDEVFEFPIPRKESALLHSFRDAGIQLDTVDLSFAALKDKKQWKTRLDALKLKSRPREKTVHEV